eukprot:scaffold3183_cov381-Prasinococcus_capsulatus_cf.AAC.27
MPGVRAAAPTRQSTAGTPSAREAHRDAAHKASNRRRAGEQRGERDAVQAQLPAALEHRRQAHRGADVVQHEELLHERRRARCVHLQGRQHAQPLISAATQQLASEQTGQMVAVPGAGGTDLRAVEERARHEGPQDGEEERGRVAAQEQVEAGEKKRQVRGHEEQLGGVRRSVRVAVLQDPGHLVDLHFRCVQRLGRPCCGAVPNHDQVTTRDVLRLGADRNQAAGPLRRSPHQARRAAGAPHRHLRAALPSSAAPTTAAQRRSAATAAALGAPAADMRRAPPISDQRRESRRARTHHHPDDGECIYRPRLGGERGGPTTAWRRPGNPVRVVRPGRTGKWRRAGRAQSAKYLVPRWRAGGAQGPRHRR